jgi:hypothetical protein
MAEATKLTLTVDGERTEIALRCPAPGELRGLKLADILQLDVGALIRLVPRISAPALREDQVAQLSLADFARLGGAVVGFFDDGLTG